MKNIIIRNGLRGEVAVFDADTETESNIKMWDGVHGHAMEDASLAYYRSTVPVEDKAKVEEIIKNWTSNFGDREIFVRQRLVKRTSKNKEGAASAENVRPIDVEKLKRDLLSAFSKALETI